jgi:hypothetical protein
MVGMPAGGGQREHRAAGAGGFHAKQTAIAHLAQGVVKRARARRGAQQSDGFL